MQTDTATITSTKGTYTGTVADCLAWQIEQQGAFADLTIGDHTMRLGDEIGETQVFEVDDCAVESGAELDAGQTQAGRVVMISSEAVKVAFDDGSCVWLSVESLTDGSLTAA